MLLTVGIPVQGKLVGTGKCDTAWCRCDRGKQEQEAQSLFRQLTLGLHIQKTGMGALEEAAGWWSSHVLLTSAKSCPKLQPRKFPVQPSAKHSFAQADP